jgi:hypothetical protein
MINSSFKSIEEASQVGKTGLCILCNFNPLSGYEGMPFEKAVNQARKLLNAMFFQNPRYSVKHGKG